MCGAGERGCLHVYSRSALQIAFKISLKSRLWLYLYLRCFIGYDSGPHPQRINWLLLPLMATPET